MRPCGGTTFGRSLRRGGGVPIGSYAHHILWPPPPLPPWASLGHPAAFHAPLVGPPLGSRSRVAEQSPSVLTSITFSGQPTTFPTWDTSVPRRHLYPFGGTPFGISLRRGGGVPFGSYVHHVNGASTAVPTAPLPMPSRAFTLTSCAPCTPSAGLCLGPPPVEAEESLSGLTCVALSGHPHLHLLGSPGPPDTLHSPLVGPPLGSGVAEESPTVLCHPPPRGTHTTAISVPHLSPILLTFPCT